MVLKALQTFKDFLHFWINNFKKSKILQKFMRIFWRSLIKTFQGLAYFKLKEVSQLQ